MVDGAKNYFLREAKIEPYFKGQVLINEDLVREEEWAGERVQEG